MRLVREVSIENYKSIRKLTVDLGQVNVLIGANGSGKSNLLEAIVLGSASARNKLDNEYLVPRGIRVVEQRFMRSAFPLSDADAPIAVSFKWHGEDRLRFVVDLERSDGLPPDREEPEAQLVRAIAHRDALVAERDALRIALRIALEKAGKDPAEDPVLKSLADLAPPFGLPPDALAALKRATPPDFLVFSPENSALRVFQGEPQVLPLGTKGEGLFAHLKALSVAGREEVIATLGERLALFDWFERLEIPRDLAPGERSLLIRDRYLAEGALFDQRSANEGFLFALFYLTLFISDATPSFFAIDNVDAALNPKLVTSLVEQLIALAKQHDKQVIFTTHNPAVLDALNLADDEQRLFVTERGNDGATRARRISQPKPIDGDPPVSLSEAFARGFLGGLPKNF